MDIKLTLKMNEEVIDKAKLYAKEKGTSLSKLVEHYFDSIAQDPKEKNFKISPLIKSLTGVIPASEPKKDKNDYVDYLIEKYK